MATMTDITDKLTPEMRADAVKATLLNDYIGLVQPQADPFASWIVTLDWRPKDAKKYYDFYNREYVFHPLWKLNGAKILNIQKNYNYNAKMIVALSMPVAGKFRRQKDTILYEYQGTRWTIPYDVNVQFVNDVPMGVQGVPIRTKRQGSARNSEW